MSTSEIIDEVICLERAAEGVTVRVGPAVSDRGSAFTMKDEMPLDWIKKLFIKDHQVYRNEALDERFFIQGHPGPLYSPLGVDILALIEGLPPGATLGSDGSILTLRLPGAPTEAQVQEALTIGRALYQNNRRHLTLLEQRFGARPYSRASWDACPSPQLRIVEGGIEIEVEIGSHGHPAFYTTAPRHLPQGMLWLKDGSFEPYREGDAPLLEALSRAGGQSLAPSLGSIALLCCKMSSLRLSLNLYTETNEQTAQAALRLLALLAEPHDGPFR